MTPNIIPCFLDWCRAYWEQRLDAAVQAEREQIATLREALVASCVCGGVEAINTGMIPTGTWEFCRACEGIAATKEQ